MAFTPAEHGPGPCAALYDPSGELIVSVGADSALLVRSATSGEEQAMLLEDHGYVGITAVAMSPDGKTLLTGCVSGYVRRFSFPDVVYKDNVCRFDTAVRFLAFSGDGKHLAAVPEDSSVVSVFEMAAVAAGAKPVATELQGHKHFVRAVAFDPTGHYLASSGGDGALLIWDTSRGFKLSNVREAFSSAKFLKDAKATPDRNLHKMSWRPDGKVLAVPYGTQDVLLMQAGTWKEIGRLRGGQAAGGHIDDVSVVEWSPSGRYIASGDVAGRVVFWDTTESVVVDSRAMTADGQTVSAISWDPHKNSLLVANVAGTVSTPWMEVIPPELAPPFDSVANLIVEGESDIAAALADSPTKPPKVASLIEDEADDADEAEPDANEDDDTIDEAALYEGAAAADKFSHVLQSIEQRVKENEKLVGSDGMQEDDSDRYDRHAPRETPAQLPFNSGATPLEDGRRQLTWNLIGRVTSVERRDHAALEIEFEDTTKHRRPVSFQDSYRYTLADLSDVGAVFAAPSQGYSPSRVHFRFFEAWDRETWSVDLPGAEEAVSVAVGKKMVIVATSKRQLRVFSYAGLQLVTLAIPGPVVTVAASDTDMLAVVYHAGRGLPTEQSLNLQLWDLHSRKSQPATPLPLSAGATTLQWLGFATNGTLVSADSAGVVRALLPTWDYNWTPIADLGEPLSGANPEERLSIVGLHLDYELQHLQCVPYKLPRKFPVVLPKPMMKQVPISLDLLDSSDMHEQYEPILRQNVLICAVDNALMAGDAALADGLLRREKKELLKLIITCVKADEGAKLLEVCGMLGEAGRKELLGHAAQVANKFRKAQLVAHVQAALAEENAAEEYLEQAAPVLQQQEQEETIASQKARRTHLRKAAVDKEKNAMDEDGQPAPSQHNEQSDAGSDTVTKSKPIDDDSDDIASDEDLDNLESLKPKTAAKVGDSNGSQGSVDDEPEVDHKKNVLATSNKQPIQSRSPSAKVPSKRKKAGNDGKGKSKRSKLTGVKVAGNPFGTAKTDASAGVKTPKTKPLGSFFGQKSA